MSIGHNDLKIIGQNDLFGILRQVMSIGHNDLKIIGQNDLFGILWPIFMGPVAEGH